MRGQGTGAVRTDDGWRERAAADAENLAGLLDAEQRRRWMPGVDRSLLVRRLEEERLEVLRTAPRGRTAERESAAAALAADAGLQRLDAQETRAGCAVAIVGTVFLLVGGAAVLLQHLVLLGIAALALTVAGALLGVQLLRRRAQARRRRRILLDWAVDRPGQLGRGLPLLTATAPVESSHRRGIPSLLLVLSLLGAALLGFGLWPLLEHAGTATVDASLLLWGGLLLGVCLVAVLVGRLSARTARRRDSALEWLPTSKAVRRREPDDEDPDACEDG